MRLRKFAALAAAFCILLSGCTIEVEDGVDEVAFDDLRESIVRSRAAEEEIADMDALAQLYRPSTDFQQRTEQELAFELQRTTTQKASVARLTRLGARSDVGCLMDMLREDYGAYQFFGGDDAFDQLEQALLERIDDACADTGKLSVLDMEQILRDLLPTVISDRGFYIRDAAITPGDSLYRVQDVYFTQRDGSFYYGDAKVLSVAEGDPADYIKPTISPNGAVVYSLWKSFPSGYDPTSRFFPVELEGAEPLNLRWQAEYIDGYSNYAYGQGFLEGSTTSPDGGISVPVVASSDLNRSGDEFVASAARPDGEKVLILDLRVCGGSDETYIRKWLESYAGAAPQISELRLHRTSPINSEIFGDSIPAESTTHGASVEDSGGDRMLILLVGGNSAAAETAQRLAHRMPNVITVGGVSTGATLTADPAVRYLPESGIRLTFGTTLRLAEGMYDDNGGVCLQPDLYTNPADALVLVREMVSHYGLNG